MKQAKETLTVIALFIACVLMVLITFEYTYAKDKQKAEKLQLEIQHLKYQVGIDSLRYDLEKQFYEKRKEKK